MIGIHQVMDGDLFAKVNKKTKKQVLVLVFFRINKQFCAFK